MKELVLVVTILAAAIYALDSNNQTEEKKWNCPLERINFLFGDIHTIHTESWQDCGSVCNIVEECKFWTWLSDRDGCYLKNSDEGLQVTDFAISGEKGCK